MDFAVVICCQQICLPLLHSCLFRIFYKQRSCVIFESERSENVFNGQLNDLHRGADSRAAPYGDENDDVACSVLCCDIDGGVH